MKTALRLQTEGLFAARITSVLIIAGAALATVWQPASGQVIYSTGFEPTDGFQPGTVLVGQDDWIAPPPLSPNAAVVTRDHPRIGQQAVHVLGGDLEHQDFINEVTGGYYDAIGSYRRGVNYDTGGSQTVRLSAWVRIDGPRTAAGNNFFSASLAGRAETISGGAPGSASVGELAISSDGHAYVYSGNDSVPTFLASMPVKLCRWHRLSVIADFSAQQSSFFVDGRCLGTFPFDPSESYTGVLLRGAILTYTAPDTQISHKADYAAHFDQFSMRVVRSRDCDDDGAGADRGASQVSRGAESPTL